MYNGILGEIGLQGTQQMGGPVASKGIAVQQVQVEEVKQEDPEADGLEARLAALRM